MIKYETFLEDTNLNSFTNEKNLFSFLYKYSMYSNIIIKYFLEYLNKTTIHVNIDSRKTAPNREKKRCLYEDPTFFVNVYQLTMYIPKNIFQRVLQNY